MEVLLIGIILVLMICIALIKIDELNLKNNTPKQVSSDEVSTETPVEPQQLYPYKKKMLLTKTEYSFYRILKAECDKHQYLICPKVRMEDFLEITCKDEKLKYRGYIKSRHIDFMICDSNLHILCGIELDDASHNAAKIQKADEFKDQVFNQIELPLHRIRVGKDNYTEKLNTIFNEIKKDSI